MILHQVAENFLCWAQKQSDLAQYLPDCNAVGIAMVVLGSWWSDHWDGCHCGWHMAWPLALAV